MNKRIKELAEQATIEESDGFKYFDKEKFAELIIRECAQEAYDCAEQIRNDDEYSEDNMWPHFASIATAIGNDIKDKFGVN